MFELIGNGFCDDESLGRDAGLSIVKDASLDRDGAGCLKIRARHNYKWVASTELQHDFLDSLRSGHSDLDSRAFTSCQRCCHDARIVEDSRNLFGTNQQRLKRSFGESRPQKEILDRQRALRNNRSVLEQSDIADHQCRCRETQYLPKWKIPGHYRKNRPKRLVTNVTVACGCFDDFIGEELFCLFGVITAYPRAFGGFFHGGAKRLAHFRGHDSGERFFLILQDGRGSEKHARALREGDFAVLQECSGGLLELSLNLGIR